MREYESSEVMMIDDYIVINTIITTMLSHAYSNGSANILVALLSFTPM